MTEDQVLDISIKMSKDNKYINSYTLYKEEYLIDDYKFASKEIYLNRMENNLQTDEEFTTTALSFEPNQFYQVHPFYVYYVSINHFALLNESLYRQIFSLFG
ncbi:unnamed protein product [Paramecium sonneborni]|uniref:Uncharacterized protein n=1 Tax=Paramecium sonneborni TaxID=65129 RepID=A0A8S1PP18_9CILI|nr:unnamed protein product [Paramecium sonneborni]